MRSVPAIWIVHYETFFLLNINKNKHKKAITEEVMIEVGVLHGTGTSSKFIASKCK